MRKTSPPTTRRTTAARSTGASSAIEQACYLLEGRAIAEVGGETRELAPGDCCFFPADVPHKFTAIGETPVKLLVVYSPPYGEDPRKVIR